MQPLLWWVYLYCEWQQMYWVTCAELLRLGPVSPRKPCDQRGHAAGELTVIEGGKAAGGTHR